ncbi:MAG: type II toxin-antitoxin system Phd/YefM family antitoxin [Verrucomicrobiaceae bacterium]|nr:type II toxin-antitoxin system Phd/YefM family antitoxin [Verrucomicrobiaceae bacterium]
MIQLEDIHPLTSFQRNAKAHLARLNRTQRPEVLTVNGRAAGVVMGREAYEKLLACQEELAALKSIKAGLDDMKKGRTVSMATAHKRLREL